MSDPNAPFRATAPPWGVECSLSWYVYRGPDMIWIFGRDISDSSRAFLEFHGLIPDGELLTFHSDSPMNETIRAWTP